MLIIGNGNKTDFGHFISLNRMNSIRLHLINRKKFVSFLDAVFCPKDVAIARKIIVLPNSRG